VTDGLDNRIIKSVQVNSFILLLDITPAVFSPNVLKNVGADGAVVTRPYRMPVRPCKDIITILMVI
jgi:hypothetical protein